MTDPAGYSFEYGGVHMGPPDHGLFLVRAPMSAMPDVHTDLQEYGARDGAATQGTTFDPRRWTDVVHLRGNNYPDVWRMLDNVKFALDPRKGNQVLRYDYDLRLLEAQHRQWLAKLNGPIIVNPRGPDWMQLNLNWLASDPIAKALSATVELPTIDASPKTFHIPTSAAEVVGGTDTVKPTFKILNTVGIAVTTVVLANVTTGESLTWTGNLANGAYLRINSETEHIEKSNDDITYSNALLGLQDGDPFPQLAPRVRNEFTLTGFSSATLTVTYTEGFI